MTFAAILEIQNQLLLAKSQMTVGDFFFYGFGCLAMGIGCIYIAVKSPNKVFWDVNIRGYGAGGIGILIGVYFLIKGIMLLFFSS